MNLKQKRLAGFSILETIVSMGIIAIVLVMLNTVIVQLTLVSQKSLARSFVREQISQVTDQIVTDIRNANRIESCGGNSRTDTAQCDISNAALVSWTTCQKGSVTTICKKDATGNVVFQTSPQLNITQLSFESGVSLETNFTRRNILVTVVGDFANSTLAVQNIIRQTVVSTRNYVFQ